MPRAEMQVLLTIRTACESPLVPGGPAIVSDRTWRQRHVPLMRKQIEECVLKHARPGEVLDALHVRALLVVCLTELVSSERSATMLKAIAEDLETAFSEAKAGVPDDTDPSPV